MSVLTLISFLEHWGRKYEKRDRVVIEFVNDAEAFLGSRGRSEELVGLGHRRVVGMVVDGGLGLGELVTGDYGGVGGSGLVVGRDFGIADRVKGFGGGHEGGVGSLEDEVMSFGGSSWSLVRMAGEDGEKERRRVMTRERETNFGGKNLSKKSD